MEETVKIGQGSPARPGECAAEDLSVRGSKASTAESR